MLNGRAELLEIKRQAIAEGCNIGSVPEAPVWLVNQRAEIAERKVDLLRAALEDCVGELEASQSDERGNPDERIIKILAEAKAALAFTS